VSELGKAWVRVPPSAKRGETVEIRAMVTHPMESGFRLDNVGQRIPRHIVHTFTCACDGEQVFLARLHPAVSTNPYFVFHLLAARSAELLFTWADDQGGVATHRARLEVLD
jgi:sulfur-oxidizing protein SoxZ